MSHSTRKPGIDAKLATPETPMHFGSDNFDFVKNNIEAKGYCILQNALPTEKINSMRDFWLGAIKPEKVSRKFVRGDLVLGEKNFLSYSKIKDWCMFRNFDFLWNEQTHNDTTNLCIELHKF